MDLRKTIQDLIEEKQRLERVIASLEALRAGQTSTGVLIKSTRGRKSMGDKEREEVSRRMKRYWANRRKARQLEKS